MKKIFLLMLLSGVIAFGISSYTTVSINPILKKTAHYIGPKVMGTRVQLEDAKLSTLSGYGTIHNVYLANPVGFPRGHCIQIGEIDINMLPSSIGTGTIIIDNLTIKAMDISHITNRKENNFDILLQNLRNKLPEPREFPPNPSKDIDYKKVIGNRYIIKNVHVITPSVSGSMPKPQKANFSVIMDDMHFTDIGEAENGVPFLVALEQILTKIEHNVEYAIMDTHFRYKDR
ncbi:AsmA family protein [Halodesulfovibrio marinisediminis]|uniref:Uncharacterized protein n=1 Tax=Halodesulfovibrio marinisediminis DSM 17456 TaxID=1121457 RepID=A0A1N6FWE7_9BACT|nr:hypothetical protein [Halodesulfovibrio marinisediminis]SIN99573.1 hypothetical protein SAMN02745161_1550 [Halodesulfovibrio marinisediminis DSM 17456]